MAAGGRLRSRTARPPRRSDMRIGGETTATSSCGLVVVRRKNSRAGARRARSRPTPAVTRAAVRRPTPVGNADRRLLRAQLRPADARCGRSRHDAGRAPARPAAPAGCSQPEATRPRRCASRPHLAASPTAARDRPNWPAPALANAPACSASTAPTAATSPPETTSGNADVVLDGDPQIDHPRRSSSRDAASRSTTAPFRRQREHHPLPSANRRRRHQADTARRRHHRRVPAAASTSAASRNATMRRLREQSAIRRSGDEVLGMSLDGRAGTACVLTDRRRRRSASATARRDGVGMIDSICVAASDQRLLAFSSRGDLGRLARFRAAHPYGGVWASASKNDASPAWQPRAQGELTEIDETARRKRATPTPAPRCPRLDLARRSARPPKWSTAPARPARRPRGGGASVDEQLRIDPRSPRRCSARRPRGSNSTSGRKSPPATASQFDDLDLLHATTEPRAAATDGRRLDGDAMRRRVAPFAAAGDFAGRATPRRRDGGRRSMTSWPTASRGAAVRRRWHSRP